MDSTLTPPAVASALIKQGIKKHQTRLDVVFFKAVAAGVMLSYGGLLSLVLSGGSPSLTESNPGLVKILGGFVFPVGLVMIVLQGLELVTSNMMVLPMAVVMGSVPWWSLILNWIVVFFGNLVGSLFFGAILTKYSGILAADPYPAYIAANAVRRAVTPHWHQIFLRGIACNWLVCVAIWQATGARDTISKVIGIWLPIWLFVACSFDHVVANMFSLPLGIMFHSKLTVAEYIRKSLIAAFIGNVVGANLLGLPAVYFYWDELRAEFGSEEVDPERFTRRKRSGTLTDEDTSTN